MTATGDDHSWFDARRILRETVVRHVEYHAELSSTNTHALEQCAAAGDCPRLIVAGRQTSGRGRGRNTWWSAAGSLTFSLVLEPAALGIPAARWPELSLTAGSAVAAAMRRMLPSAEVRLKWPNDVFLNGRKVCGILIEAPPQAAHRLVVGVGVNVNNSLQGAGDLRTRATSMSEESTLQHHPLDVLLEILQQFDGHVRMLAAGDERLRSLWREMCLLTGRVVTLDDGSRQTTGTCLGIDDDGALRLQTEAGPQRFFGGVVTSFE